MSSGFSLGPLSFVEELEYVAEVSGYINVEFKRDENSLCQQS